MKGTLRGTSRGLQDGVYGVGACVYCVVACVYGVGACVYGNPMILVSAPVPLELIGLGWGRVWGFMTRA